MRGVRTNVGIIEMSSNFLANNALKNPPNANKKEVNIMTPTIKKRW